MKNIFSITIILQFFFAVLFINHRVNKPLNSDLMFGVLIASILVSIYMYWQIFTSKILVKSHKIFGLICASLPLAWILLLLNYIA
jgi:hypothetical protein